jgi:branched-chain amino acid transport system ATP-binding protein
VVSGAGVDPRVPILEVSGVCFGFGGVAALTDVDLTVGAGECVALIGPNGAGKSTLINCLTQISTVHSGSIRVGGRDCVGLPASAMITLGVKRTFQNIETFAEMTVREILEVGAHHLGSTSIAASVFASRRVATERAALRSEVERTADTLGLHAVLDTRVAGLPYGVQKKVDLARALVGGARLLLLDEPAAGLSEQEWEQLAELLQDLKTRSDMGILLIEHQLGFVRRLADRLYALDAGRVVAQGDPAAVLADRRVIESYIGLASA